ncbi:GNAT family N-acetyltransferase [Candidatus Aquiluna sp. UB-MaderosW2red]|jgi:GNAT superfamily N-acetyltransferase|uniref:GNAT family N-acetyltransferase n=1 Tax=Candidatus Aquiluna sp. UB-MaderosW2red TaxID=1855377 RepID=UPI000875B5CB|nr:GNAT family N-acetyltransferase [Candidatus Aquiluna sp. UB-MaderosW2red]SCX03730.1 Acetyltransferase (GNAT) domain-containing protein [Candidatus Aquiluna sp. UB-MaderosW2red]
MGELSDPQTLSISHDLRDFNSGNANLDQWLMDSAHRANQTNSARVVVIRDQNQVIAYSALATGSIVITDLPSEFRNGLSRHPVPIILLARLAVDTRYQGLGLAVGLLKHALVTALGVEQEDGVVALATHPIDQSAKSFYLKYGFVQSPGDKDLMALPLRRY